MKKLSALILPAGCAVLVGNVLETELASAEGKSPPEEQINAVTVDPNASKPWTVDEIKAAKPMKAVRKRPRGQAPVPDPSESQPK